MLESDGEDEGTGCGWNVKVVCSPVIVIRACVMVLVFEECGAFKQHALVGITGLCTVVWVSNGPSSLVFDFAEVPDDSVA